MFKKLIAAALGAVVLVSSAGIAVSADSGKIDNKKYPNSYYHGCSPGHCGHYYEGSYLCLNAVGNWGFVYSTKDDHTDSYKYISLTTYRYDSQHEEYHSPITVRKGGTDFTIVSPDATIDGYVAKLVYNGQIFHTAANTQPYLQKYLIGSFRSGCKIK